MEKKLTLQRTISSMFLLLFHIAFIVFMGIFGSTKFQSAQNEVPGLYASN
jgi:hypothetical protein